MKGKMSDGLSACTEGNPIASQCTIKSTYVDL